MARITMRNSQKATFAEVFEVYISAVTARGVKDKTIATYKQHFHAISKRLDVSLPINRLNSTVLDNMILQMRKEGLSDSSINSYTRSTIEVKKRITRYTITLLQEANIHTDCTMLDPWYNKGFGGVLPDAEYDEFIQRLLNDTFQLERLASYPLDEGTIWRYGSDSNRRLTVLQTVLFNRLSTVSWLG